MDQEEEHNIFQNQEEADLNGLEEVELYNQEEEEHIEPPQPQPNRIYQDDPEPTADNNTNIMPTPPMPPENPNMKGEIRDLMPPPPTTAEYDNNPPQSQSTGYDGYSQNLDSNASQADILKELIRPFNQSLSGGVLNKELKISNLNADSMALVVDYTDVTIQAASMGCTDAARFFLLVRDTILCASSSLKGFERETQVTSVNIHKLPKEARDNWSIFNTKKDNQPNMNH